MDGLKGNIGEVCGSEFWERITSTYIEDGQPCFLEKYEGQFEYGSSDYNVVWIRKVYLDADDTSAVDRCEDVHFWAQEVER